MNDKELIAEARKLLFSDSELGYEYTGGGGLIYRLADALEVALAARQSREAICEDDREALEALRKAHEAAGSMPQGTMDHETQWLPFANLYNAAERVIDSRAAVPDAATEQVEAAAKALHETRNPWIGAYGDWGAAGYEIKQAFRESARAALAAAQGAAPQVGVLPETGNELRDEDGDLISSGKHLRILQQGMYVCDTCTNSLGLNVRWDHAVLRETHTPLPVEGESNGDV